MADEPAPKMLVDDRMPQPAETWRVTELAIDPTWHGGLVEVGGRMIPVLGFCDPSGRWTHYSLSPSSLAALRKWIEDLPDV